MVLFATAGLTAAVMLWLFITTVPPLRRIATNAELIAADHRDVPNVSADRLDEIGSVAAGLNHDVAHAPGEATDPRLRG